MHLVRRQIFQTAADIEKGKLTYVNSVALSFESGTSVQGDQFAIPAGDDFSNGEDTQHLTKKIRRAVGRR